MKVCYLVTCYPLYGEGAEFRRVFASHDGALTYALDYVNGLLISDAEAFDERESLLVKGHSVYAEIEQTPLYE